MEFLWNLGHWAWESLAYRSQGPMERSRGHFQSPKWEQDLVLTAVISAASSCAIMWIILSLQKGLHRHITFYFAVISGTPEHTGQSEFQGKHHFSGLKIIVGPVTTCFLSLGWGEWESHEDASLSGTNMADIPYLWISVSGVGEALFTVLTELILQW